MIRVLYRVTFIAQVFCPLILIHYKGSLNTTALIALSLPSPQPHITIITVFAACSQFANVTEAKKRPALNLQKRKNILHN